MSNILDKETTSKDIALASFSGYLAFSSNMLENGKVILKTGEKLPVIGKIFAVTDGVISATFDSNGNPDKELSSVLGTALTAYTATESGAAVGGMIGGAIGSIFPVVGTAVGGGVGAVVGGTTGAVVGALYSDNFFAELENQAYNAYEKILEITNKISNNLEIAKELANKTADETLKFLDNYASDYADEIMNSNEYKDSAPEKVKEDEIDEKELKKEEEKETEELKNEEEKIKDDKAKNEVEIEEKKDVNKAEIDGPKIDEVDKNKNPYGLVETAQHNVALYNQQINQSYDDIMSFLLG